MPAASDMAAAGHQTRPQTVAKVKRKRLTELRLHLANIYRLVIKEMRSIRHDPIVLAVMAYCFTIAVYSVATGASTEAKNLSIAVVDEDHSDLSRRIFDGFTPPTFRAPVEITAPEIDPAMNSDRFIFVVEIPPKFEADILAGRQTSVQIDVDATAVAMAFNGKVYIQNVIINYVSQFIAGREGVPGPPVKIDISTKFNPNAYSSWFSSVMQVLSNLTMLTVLLTGAALIREGEQGTIEHLLVMPVVPIEIMLSKILANGLVVLVAAELSTFLVVRWWLQVPIAGSALLYLGGACLYVLTVAALGIMLGTQTSTMAQFGLLTNPVLLVLMLLSGATTPMESMPTWLQYVMNIISPMPHFVVFAQDVLFRGADFSVVWPELLAMTAIGAVYFAFSLYNFRRVVFGGS